MTASFRTLCLALVAFAFSAGQERVLCAAEGQSLFNGHSLEGWIGDEKIWSVQDGQIIGTSVGNKQKTSTFLVYQGKGSGQGGEFGDFRLTFKARVDNNNSGVQYRSKMTHAKTWQVAGHQIDMHPKPEYTAMLYSQDTGRGIVARRGQKVVISAETGKPEVVGKTTDPTPVDLSQWHEYEVIAQGNHLIHKIDGQVTVDIIDNHKEAFSQGIFALQVHGGAEMTARFKDFVVEKLSEAPDEIKTLVDGFQVEKLYEVPESMGSWVSLAADDRGRLIASDQREAGFYLITPGKPGVANSTKVEKLPIDLSGAQGLAWVDDSLYAMISNNEASGLHRLTDADGDGLLDTDEYLKKIKGAGEHGPHPVVLSPDGKSLFVGGGNHTALPEGITASRIPKNWGEDQLLPRRWDARGHAKGRLAPAGWFCKIDPEGKEWEIFSIGFRNEYDAAFNADGELFAYDADMEWDLGLPWYRPTRVVHATSGSEFGWRSGTGKWPAYYEDSLPAALNIGPGSPTGVTFGYGAKFPAKYQKAMFLLDWTFGTIYTCHLTPEGASYRGKKEEFLTGLPLPVNDAVIGNDGAMYFTVGGRRMQSALYRVTYVGDQSIETVEYKNQAGADLRALRHKLELTHGSGGGDLDFIFANLGHSDRFIRYAARIALESEPVANWRQRALAETDLRASITALMALARQGEASDTEPVLQSLDRIDFATLSDFDQLALMRTYSLVFIRLGEPIEATRQKLIAKWDALYPSSSPGAEHFNREMVQLLVRVRAPSVVEKTLTMMAGFGAEQAADWSHLVARSARYGGAVGRMISDMPPSRVIHYAFVLRNVKEGWTLDQRRRYFQFFMEAAKHSGGQSYPKFLEQIRDDALATCSTKERMQLEEITSQSLSADPFQPTPPQGPGRKWTQPEALAALTDKIELLNRDDKEGFNRGRNLFHAVSCSKCHRLYGEGGAIGPDLTTVAKKFSLADLLDSILTPSKVISDQYASHLVQTDGGLTVRGRAIEIGDEVHVYTEDADAPPTVIPREDIEEMALSKNSQMPVGLVDTLSEDELKALITYIMSAGQ